MLNNPIDSLNNRLNTQILAKSKPIYISNNIIISYRDNKNSFYKKKTF